VGSALDWAQTNACAWLRYQGFFDAGVVADPGTAGADIRGSDVVAQVKFTPKPATIDEIKELNAVMIATKRQGFYFSVSGFTEEAVEWGDMAGVMLVRLILDGDPANESARKWMRRPERVTPTRPVERLKAGDRVADSNGGYRCVAQVHTRKGAKGLLHFTVEFEDGGNVEYEIGKNVVLYEPSVSR